MSMLFIPELEKTCTIINVTIKVIPVLTIEADTVFAAGKNGLIVRAWTINAIKAANVRMNPGEYKTGQSELIPLIPRMFTQPKSMAWFMKSFNQTIVRESNKSTTTMR